MAKPVIVFFDWVEPGGRFVATSQDVPGLVVEEATFEEMSAAVRALVPVLLAESADAADEIPVELVSHVVARREDRRLSA
jgi:hypothetical protein